MAELSVATHRMVNRPSWWWACTDGDWDFRSQHFGAVVVPTWTVPPIDASGMWRRMRRRLEIRGEEEGNRSFQSELNSRSDPQSITVNLGPTKASSSALYFTL